MARRAAPLLVASLLGIAAMDSGHLTHSIFALERVLAVQPDNVLARAEIARVYLMLGEVRTSRQEFETVSRSDDLPPAARNTVEQYLTAFREVPVQAERAPGEALAHEVPERRGVRPAGGGCGASQRPCSGRSRRRARTSRPSSP